MKDSSKGSVSTKPKALLKNLELPKNVFDHFKILFAKDKSGTAASAKAAKVAWER
jgi:hypothetical protein